MIFHPSLILIGILPSTLASALQHRQDSDSKLPANCGRECLVPANYGVCPSDDTVCFCSSPDVVEAVGVCVIRACTESNDRDATVAYMLGVCESFGVTVSIPSAVQTAIPSTLVPSHLLPHTTSSLEPVIPSGAPSKPSGPSSGVIAGAVTAAIAALFICILAFICWTRRPKHTRTKSHKARHRGIRRRSGNYVPLDRADTVKSFVAGTEDRDYSGGGLWREKTQKFWTSLQPIPPRVGYAGIGTRDPTTVSMLRANPTLSPPPPPPPLHLNSRASVDTREDWRRRGSATTTSPSVLSNPFATPTHSPSTSFDSYSRYPMVSPNSLPSTAVSLSTPFSGAKPFAIWDRYTPPSSASSPGALQEKPHMWAAWERRAATEGSAPHTPATPATPASANTYASAPHSAFFSTPTRVGATNDRGGHHRGEHRGGHHKRNLTIDTAVLPQPNRKVETVVATVNPQPQDLNLNPNPDPFTVQVDAVPDEKPRSNSEEEAAKRLQDMFTSDSPVSEQDPHESLRLLYHASSTGHGPSSPAVPESATIGMFGIGFGIMGRKWEPRHSLDMNSNEASPMYRSLSSSKKSMRRTGSLSRPGGGGLTPIPSSPEMTTPPRISSPTYRLRESKERKVVSTGTIESLFGAYGITGSTPATPTGRDASDEEEASLVLGADIPDTSGAGLSRGGGTFGSGRTQPSSTGNVMGPRQISPLSPRRAPPRRSVAPEDLFPDGSGLSRQSTFSW